MTRLRTVSAQDPGWSRRRRGSGFTYLDEYGARLPPDAADRIRALAIPPAWSEVWICPDEKGHLQAVGTDDAGRRQYLYHPEWRRKQDLAKHERALALAARLPSVRRRLSESLPDAVPGREGVVDLAVRLIDLGCFRIGSEEYTGANGSFGLSTLELRHVRRTDGAYEFSYTGKAGVEQHLVLDDEVSVASLHRLTRRRDPNARLLAARVGREWVPISPEEVNTRLSELCGLEVTSKDLRTWHATVIAALALGEVDRASSRSARARQVRAAVAEVAETLGNSPTIARSSYVDPRVIDLFEDGRTISATVRRLPADPEQRRDRLDRAVRRLLL